MGFCEFSNEKIVKNNLEISNFFVTDYMLGANELQLKMYLYGLYLCQNQNIPENNMEALVKKFNLTDYAEVLGLFAYWEELGLVKILSIGNEYSIKYLPISKYDKIEKDIKKGKYSKFCSDVQEFITGRQILPNEYYEYINFLDYSHMEQNALLSIVNYAVTIKGSDINYKYILTIAKAWAYKGLLSEKDVLKYIEESNTYDEELIQVMKALGKTKTPDLDEKEMWETFTKKWNFDFNFIINVAKDLKKKKKANFNTLADKLEKYYKLNIRNVNEAIEYETALEQYWQTAKIVTQELGLYYENLSPIIDTYIVNWYNHGYDFETIKKVAMYCFKNNIRTLDAMNNVIEKFIKLGLTSMDSIDEYINEIITIDKNIKLILEKLMITRNVNHFDRDLYKIWTSKYNFSDDIMDYAILKAQGKFQPMQYLNKILASYYDKKVKTLDDAKALDNEFMTNNNPNNNIQTNAKPNNVIITHSYTDEELNSFFTNLDEIDI